MNNTIKVNRVDSLIEEEVGFSVNNLDIVGFNVSPRELVLGETYEAEIDIFMIDFLDMKKQEDAENKEIKHINNFTYHLWGKLLDKNVLDVGFYITSDLFEDYQYLAGEYVSLVVDRLQVYCE
ncbi:hypothetical protein I6N96_16255 [Enterococcus sp. BWM-S5]|uniref:Uncharacterized protein n=1 Tax=Enterococcus larvae TaxID=2794352 RepID=A0ABS4CQ03_9ENTE|nr:hypothetical protein [Enterococcus larvae]MBP1047844.1 hypothetical protein [Enterococcus larvae]